MKIVCGPIGNRYLKLVKTFKDVVDDFTYWNPDSQNIYDVFDVIKPDLFLMETKWTNEHKVFSHALPKETNVILFGDETPQFVNPVCIVAQPSISELMKKHIESHNPIFIKDYADVVSYWGGEYKEDFKSDIAFVCNNIECLSLDNIETMLEIGFQYRLKVAGQIRFPIPQYLGAFTGSIENELSFLKSSKIAMDFGFNNVLNQVANGIFTVTNIPNELVPLFSDIPKYIKDEELRKEQITGARHEVLTSATSYHRVKEIFEHAGISEFSQKINSKILDKISCN